MLWFEDYLLRHQVPAEAPCSGSDCNAPIDEVRLVVDPYPYEMLGVEQRVPFCATCYACRSQDV